MHIPDGWIDVPTSGVAAVGALAATTIAARRATASLRDRVTTLPAVVAAYLLVAELLVVPVGLGTGAHLIGTGLAALLVGPAVAIVCVAAVVVVQSLVLADGGVTAIGLNVVNDGVVPALVAWAIWRLLRDRLPLGAAAGIAAGLSAIAVGFAVAAELLVGGTNAAPDGVVVASITGTHLVLAVIEGVLSGAVIRLLVRQRPDLVRATSRPIAVAAPR